MQQTMEPGMTVSHVARLHGINASQIFKWCSQYDDGALTAVASEEEVVSASSSIFRAKRRRKRKFSERLQSTAGQEKGLRVRPCCPGTTTNQCLPESCHVA
ncbi:transposase [Enterobacter ludwigii]